MKKGDAFFRIPVSARLFIAILLFVLSIVSYFVDFDASAFVCVFAMTVFISSCALGAKLPSAGILLFQFTGLSIAILSTVALQCQMANIPLSRAIKTSSHLLLMRSVPLFVLIWFVIRGFSIIELTRIFRSRPWIAHIVVLAPATFFSTAAAAYKKSRQSLLLARRQDWGLEETNCFTLLAEKIELATVIVLQSAEGLGQFLSNWGTRTPKNLQNGKPMMRRGILTDVYEDPALLKLFNHVFSGRDIPEQWKEAIGSNVPEGARILDLGAGAGRLSFWCMSKGYSVLAVEQCSELCREFERNRGSSRQQEVTLLNGSFPELKGFEPRDAILLHQNVLLELINAPGQSAQNVWHSLNECLRPDGWLIVDYLDRFFPTENSNWTTIINCDIPDYGPTEYQYRVMLAEGSCVDVELRLITPRNGSVKAAIPISFCVPECKSVLEMAKKSNFHLASQSELNGSTFFPSSQVLWVFRKRSVAELTSDESLTKN